MLTLNKSTCLAQMVSYSCFLCGFGSLACKEHSPPAASESRILVRVYCRDLPVIPGQECCWNLPSEGPEDRQGHSPTCAPFMSCVLSLWCLCCVGFTFSSVCPSTFLSYPYVPHASLRR